MILVGNNPIGESIRHATGTSGVNLVMKGNGPNC